MLILDLIQLQHNLGVSEGNIWGKAGNKFINNIYFFLIRKQWLGKLDFVSKVHKFS